VIKRNEVREEGRKEILLFRGLGRGGGEGLERRLFGFPNVSSGLCTDKISFVKYEVCMVEDDHGEVAGRVPSMLTRPPAEQWSMVRGSMPMETDQ